MIYNDDLRFIYSNDEIIGKWFHLIGEGTQPFGHFDLKFQIVKKDGIIWVIFNCSSLYDYKIHYQYMTTAGEYSFVKIDKSFYPTDHSQSETLEFFQNGSIAHKWSFESSYYEFKQLNSIQLSYGSYVTLEIFFSNACIKWQWKNWTCWRMLHIYYRP